MYAFIAVANVSAETNTLSITYVPAGEGVPDEGPHEVVLPPRAAIGWTPYSNAGGAEIPGIPNASFGAGSVKIEATHPVVGRTMQVDRQ